MGDTPPIENDNNNGKTKKKVCKKKKRKNKARKKKKKSKFDLVNSRLRRQMKNKMRRKKNHRCSTCGDKDCPNKNRCGKLCYILYYNIL